MAKVSTRRFHTPFNSEAIKYLIGHMFRARSEQAVAATLATSLMQGGIASHDGGVHSVSVFGAGTLAAGSGESMTIDVFKNGVTILTAPYVYTPAAGARQILEIPFVAGTSIAVGDLLTVSRTYVAGGAPTMTATSVTVEWGRKN